jgi:hypothetical protein
MQTLYITTLSAAFLLISLIAKSQIFSQPKSGLMNHHSHSQTWWLISTKGDAIEISTVEKCFLAHFERDDISSNWIFFMGLTSVTGTSHKLVCSPRWDQILCPEPKDKQVRSELDEWMPWQRVARSLRIEISRPFMLALWSNAVIQETQHSCVVFTAAIRFAIMAFSKESSQDTETDRRSRKQRREAETKRNFTYMSRWTNTDWSLEVNENHGLEDRPRIQHINNDTAMSRLWGAVSANP